jgi:hypothetical protein
VVSMLALVLVLVELFIKWRRGPRAA